MQKLVILWSLHVMFRFSMATNYSHRFWNLEMIWKVKERNNYRPLWQLRTVTIIIDLLSIEEFFKDTSGTWKFAELEGVLRTVKEIDNFCTWGNWESLGCLEWGAMLHKHLTTKDLIYFFNIGHLHIETTWAI